ncbi:MAG: hypothetical protein GQ532_20060 [Methylomarinum sp.]|nr:hypothetical protein [Methylomarinum sp.]
MKEKNKYFSVLGLLCFSVLLNGCTLAYKGTGDVMISYAEDEGMPYMLAADDIELTCSMVKSFTPFLLSFSQVTTPPDQLAILFYLMTGNCAEFKAQEQELRYLRAIYSKNSIEAQDARIAQQRLRGLAARRQLIGYRYMAKAFIEPGGKCPELNSENEQLYWLMGLINGLQAIINDIASAGRVEVPMDIAAKVGRGAVCLDNEKWWGAPEAIQAAIWMAIPGNHPDDKDPEKILKHSLQMGLQQGVRIPQVLAAQVYLGLGRIEQVKNIIRNYTEIKETSASKTYKSLNQVSNLQMQAISDRLWTEATGKRTPLGKVGAFWDDPEKTVEMIDIDELL